MRFRGRYNPGMKRRSYKITLKIPREEDVRPDARFLRAMHQALDARLRAHVEGTLPLLLEAFRRGDADELAAMADMLRAVRVEG